MSLNWKDTERKDDHFIVVNVMTKYPNDTTWGLSQTMYHLQVINNGDNDDEGWDDDVSDDDGKIEFLHTSIKDLSEGLQL